MYASNEQTNAAPSRVDFSRPELCAKSRPVTCTINRQVVQPDKQNWSRLLVAITEWFIAKNNPRLAELDRRPMYGSKAFFMSEKTHFLACAQLTNGKWVCTNYNPQIIVTIIGNLCRYCGVPLNNVFITYVPKDSYVLRRKPNHAFLTKPKTTVSDKTEAAMIAILEKHFSNGIRPGSIIDINKLKNFYRAAIREELPSEIEISTLLYAIAIQHKDKIFAISSSGKKDLMKLLDRLISDNNRLFFYEEFYNIHADFLQAIHIFSPELLKTVLSRILPSLCYSRICFSIEDCVTIESEVLRCYETAVCLSYEQLKARLLYVPIDKIRQVLAQNRDFIWVNTGIYTHTSKLEIDKVEQRAIEQRIEGKIAEQGYVSLANIDVLNKLEHNPELSETAVKKGLFQICLADRYENRGNIITPKGTVLNSVAVFEDYCRVHDRLTLDELLEL